LEPEQLEIAIRQTQALTDRPFAINLFTPMQKTSVSDGQVQKAINATQSYRQKLGLSTPVVAPPYHPDFEKQFPIILQTKPAVFSFIFGLLDASLIRECRRQGILTMGTATTLEEGLALERSGVDAVIAQGVEAGAHRGMFSPEDEDPLIGTLALSRILTTHLRIPIIAAGGIMDGRGIAAALMLGAQAAQLGTAFLTCDEAGTSSAYRQVLLNPEKPLTRLTRAFSGRWARGLENQFLKEMKAKSDSILPFPVQNSFTRDIRNRATQANQSEFLSLWAGQGVNLIRSMPASQLINTLFQELEEALTNQKED
jgi:nitronate monooxygenase